jgi:hypothetical protein
MKQLKLLALKIVLSVLVSVWLVLHWLIVWTFVPLVPIIDWIGSK